MFYYYFWGVLLDMCVYVALLILYQYVQIKRYIIITTLYRPHTLICETCQLILKTIYVNKKKKWPYNGSLGLANFW